jgi:hypothetical protein
MLEYDIEFCATDSKKVLRMTEPAVATPAVSSPQIIQIGAQAPGMFANHIMVATDGNMVFLTFSQATPMVSPTAQQVSGGMQKIQNVPMIASPVAKVVLVPKMVSQLIQSLQDLSRQIEQQQQSP